MHIPGLKDTVVSPDIIQLDFSIHAVRRAVSYIRSNGAARGDLRARKELTIVRWMPFHVLHPGCMVVVLAHHGIFFVHTPVKHLDTSIREARQEGIDGPVVRHHGRDGTIRVGLEVLIRSIATSAKA